MTGRPRRAGAAALAAAILGLAGCTTPPNPIAPAAPLAPPPSAARVEAPVAATAPPTPGLLAPARVVAAPLGLGRPDRLVGLPFAEVTALLGEPGFLRRDGPAELWQYRGENCVLDLFLRKEGANLRVAHVEIRGRAVARIDADACWRALLATPRPNRAN